MSLIEILLVVAVIGILVGLLLPAAQTIRASARSTVCLGHQRQLATAAGSYAAENRGGLPATRLVTGAYWYDTLAPYLGITKGTVPATYYAESAIRGCPEFIYNPDVIGRFSYGINAYLRYGDGGKDSRGEYVDRLHNRIGGTSDASLFREFRLSAILKPSTRLYLADQDGFWTGANQGSWTPTGPDMRHRGRMALTFVDGRSSLGTAENYLAAQLTP